MLHSITAKYEQQPIRYTPQEDIRDAVEAARKANGDSGLIHEVSHAEIIHEDDIPRFAELNVAAEMCPILWYPIPGLDWKLWLGEERAKVWPVKTLLASGALAGRIAAGRMHPDIRAF